MVPKTPSLQVFPVVHLLPVIKLHPVPEGNKGVSAEEVCDVPKDRYLLDFSPHSIKTFIYVFSNEF